MNKNVGSSTEDRPVRARGRLNPKFPIGPDVHPMPHDPIGIGGAPPVARTAHPISVDPNGAPMNDYSIDPTAPYQSQVNDIYSAPTMPTLPTSAPGVPPAPGLAGLRGGQQGPGPNRMKMNPRYSELM